MIFAVGAGLSIYEGVHHLFHPSPIARPSVNYIVLSLAMVFEGVAWYFAFHEFRRTKGTWRYLEAIQRSKDPTVFVVLFEDSAAMLGLVVAFLGVWLAQVTGLAFFDGLASVMIGLILGGTAAWLAYETKGLLIGEAANKRVVNGVREIAQKESIITHVNEVLTMHMGPEYILVNLSADFEDKATAEEIEAAVARLDKEIRNQFPKVQRIFIEVEERLNR